jgi:hypothetical protein
MKIDKKPEKTTKANIAAAAIPGKEGWAYKNPKVIGAIRKGMEDARGGKLVRVDDVENFFKKL